MAQNVDGAAVAPIKADIYVVICIPSGMEIKARTAHCLFKMALKFFNTDFMRDGKPLTKAIGYINMRGSILPASRESSARQALMRGGVTHLLWIDSDMVFPDDIIHRLWSHDLDVVGANCPRKILPVVPTCEKMDGSMMWTTEKSTGLEETRRIGFGILMHKIDVLQRIAEPWYPFSYDYQVRGYDGEDTNFCRALQKAGIRMWVDHDVSKEIGHIGELVYEHVMNEEWHGGVSKPIDAGPDELVEVAA